MKAEYVNPFIVSMVNVFQTMLNCTVRRESLYIKENNCPSFPISGVIGLSGRASGTAVLSLSREAAISAAAVMLGYAPLEVNADVKDVVGELINMVAGGAKAQLAEFDMSLTIPTVVTGMFSIEFPSATPPIGILFDSPWGGMALEVGLVEAAIPVANR